MNFTTAMDAPLRNLSTPELWEAVKCIGLAKLEHRQAVPGPFHSSKLSESFWNFLRTCNRRIDVLMQCEYERLNPSRVAVRNPYQFNPQTGAISC